MDAQRRKPLNPAFRMAIQSGATESVHLRSGSDVNAADDKGRSPLILAASKGRVDICRLLLEHGADATVRDYEGRSALAVAKERRSAEIVGLLAVVDALADAECLDQSCAPDAVTLGRSAALARDIEGTSRALASHEPLAPPTVQRGEVEEAASARGIVEAAKNDRDFMAKPVEREVRPGRALFLETDAQPRHEAWKPFSVQGRPVELAQGYEPARPSNSIERPRHGPESRHDRLRSVCRNLAVAHGLRWRVAERSEPRPFLVSREELARL